MAVFVGDMPDSHAEAGQLIPPANDHFAQAAELAGESFTATADLGAATSEDFEPNPGWSKTAWWTWTAPRSGILLWNTESSSSPVIVRIFVEGAFGLEPVAESYFRRHDFLEDVFDGNGSAQVTQGRRYYLQLQASHSSFAIPGDPTSHPVIVQFAFSSEAPPPNDDFARALRLEGTNATFTASLSGATAEPDEPKIGDAALQRTAWWSWLAPGHGSVTIRRTGTNPPLSAPVIGIYGPGPFLAFTKLASSATEFGNACERHWVARDSVRWDVNPGITYHIQADRFPAFSNSSSSFDLAFTPAPSNDVPENATVLMSNDLSLAISNRGATGRRSEIAGAGQNGASSIWFKWSAPSYGIVQVTKDEPLRHDEPREEPTDETGVVVVSPSPCGGALQDLHPLPEFAPVFRLLEGEPLPYILSGNPATNRIAWEAAITTYWILMDGVGGTEGDTPMNLLFTPPPANDRFTDRIRLSSQGVRVFGRTFAATAFSSGILLEGVYREPDGAILRRSAWWEWQAPAAGRWTLFLNRGRYDNRLVLYPQAGPNAPSPIASTLDGPVVFEAEAGQVFQIGAFARTDLGSSVEFTITPVSIPILRVRDLSPAWGDLRVLRLAVPDNSGLPFVIERSPDLVEWSPALNVTNAFATVLNLEVSAFAGANFFRTRLKE